MFSSTSIIGVRSLRQISRLHVTKLYSSNIGFIGLGNMGGSMAINLAKKGNNVSVFDINSASIDATKSEGSGLNIKSVKSPLEFLEDPSINSIVTVLPESSHVLGVYNEFLLKKSRPDILFIDCTTGDINDSKVIYAKVKETGATFVDAPISGGVMGARDAMLTFMVGAESEEIFNKAKLILDAMGKKIFLCGPVGTGLAAKICNNMLLGISMMGTSEALNLGIKLGLDPKILSEILNCSSGRCWSSETYNPVPGILPNVPSSRDYAGGFATKLMTKDLGLAQNSSTSTKCPTPLGSATHQIYRMMSQTNLSEKDFSAIFQFLQSVGKLN